MRTARLRLTNGAYSLQDKLSRYYCLLYVHIVTYCNAVKKKIQGVKRLTCGSHAQRAHYLCLRPLSVRPTELTVAAASSQGEALKERHSEREALR